MENKFTEDDKVNCPFYFKNGGCRYGDQCIRRHLKPNQSSTLMFSQWYHNPPITLAIIEGRDVPEDKIAESLRDYEEFYQDIFLELCKFGEIEEIQGWDNLGDHMIGNIYVRFNNEDDSTNCKKNVIGRYYGERLIIPEYSPVSNFKDGRCKQFEEGLCKRGSYCNFMHLKIIDTNLVKACKKFMYKKFPEYKERKLNQEEEQEKDSDKNKNFYQNGYKKSFRNFDDKYDRHKYNKYDRYKYDKYVDHKYDKYDRHKYNNYDKYDKHSKYDKYVDHKYDKYDRHKYNKYDKNDKYDKHSKYDKYSKYDERKRYRERSYSHSKKNNLKKYDRDYYKEDSYYKEKRKFH